MSNTYTTKRVCKLSKQLKLLRASAKNDLEVYVRLPEHQSLQDQLCYGPHNPNTKRAQRCCRKLHRFAVKSARQKSAEATRAERSSAAV